MTTFLFWNINRKPLTEALVALVKERSVDVLVLAESTIPRRELLWALNQEIDSRFRLPFNPSARIEFYTRFSSQFLENRENRDAYLFVDTLSWWRQRFRPAEWKRMLQRPEDAQVVRTLRSRTHTGRPLGSDSFVSKLERALGRRLRALPVGRPKKKTTKKKVRKKRTTKRPSNRLRGTRWR